MALRQIREEGDEILRKTAREVENIDERIQILIDDMIETMHHLNGVGLAAQQVGILKRVVVIDLYDDNGRMSYLSAEHRRYGSLCGYTLRKDSSGTRRPKGSN